VVDREVNLPEKKEEAKMKKTVLLIMLLIACASAIYAQYDEKQILTQQANQLLMQRQYVQAEQLFFKFWINTLTT